MTKKSTRNYWAILSISIFSGLFIFALSSLWNGYANATEVWQWNISAVEALIALVGALGWLLIFYSHLKK
jgi:hypothetical protein